MKRFTSSITVIAAGLWAALAAASEHSKLVASRGLVEFHAGHHEKALELFDEALASDPTDVYARYYRGVTRGRTGNSEGAISDLQQVLAEQPDLEEATLDLGIALVEGGRFQDSIEWLERAQSVPDLKTQASLFLGIAQVRTGELDKARTNLTYAASHDPQVAPTAHYYLGIADYQQGNTERAEQQFNSVVKERADQRIGQEAQAFLDRIQSERANIYQLVGAVGFQYDSNVILAPSDSAFGLAAQQELGVTQKDDGRVTINAGGAYALGVGHNTLLTMGYDFYQSLHFTLHEFNLQDHRPSLTIEHRSGAFRFGALGRYDYYLLEASSFLSEGTILPYASYNESDVGRTEVTFRYRYRNYKEVFDLPFDLLNGPNYAPSVTQLIYLGSQERYLTVSYQYDHQDSSSSAFTYDGNQFTVGVRWMLPWRIDTEVDYSFRQDVYADGSRIIDSALDRQDGQHNVIVFAQRPITEHLNINGGYFGTFNNSNQSPFDYTRHIASVALEVRF